MTYGFGAFFQLLPGGDVSSLLLVYGFPLLLLGFALSYAQARAGGGCLRGRNGGCGVSPVCERACVFRACRACVRACVGGARGAGPSGLLEARGVRVDTCPPPLFPLQLVPVPCYSTPEAIAAREAQATDIQKQAGGGGRARVCMRVFV